MGRVVHVKKDRFMEGIDRGPLGEESLLEHQEGAWAGQEPFDAPTSDLAELVVTLLLTLPPPEAGERFSADWVDRSDDRTPATPRSTRTSRTVTSPCR